MRQGHFHHSHRLRGAASGLLWPRGLLLVSLCLFFGCGYQLAGKETHVPSGLNSLAISSFINKTFEPGIESAFTEACRKEFIRDRRVNVVDPGQADAVLAGVIRRLLVQSVAYDRSGLVLEYQATVVVDLTLTNRAGRVLWRENNFAETDWYRASSNVLTNESSRALAIERLGQSLAERIRSYFFYNF